MLNSHLRGESFTPLPHLSESYGISPSNAGFSAIAPQLSGSIAGDTPSLEDLAGCSWEENKKDEKKRPGSTTSQNSNVSRGMVISPHSFSLWKDDHESIHFTWSKYDGHSAGVPHRVGLPPTPLFASPVECLVTPLFMDLTMTECE
jgi:hypothetical protein